MMRVVLQIFVFLMLFGAAGCSTDKLTAEQILHAEEIALELPDSALSVVQSIDPATVRGKHDRAHYQLVMAEVHYYNRLAVDRDTIAQPLFDYYLDSDNHAERARAMYQYALVMQAEGENARAMYSLLEAEKSLSHLDNPRLSGLVHRTKGDIYGSECLFQNALEEYQKSATFFEQAGLKEHSIFSKFHVAYSLAELRKRKEAIDLFSQLEAEANTISYDTIVTDILLRLCYIYIEINDIGNCEIAYRRITELNDNSKCDYYCVGSLISAYKGNLSQAEFLYSKAKQENVLIPMNLKYTRYRIFEFNKDYLNALKAYQDCIRTQDRNILKAINDSVLYDELFFIEKDMENSVNLRKRSNAVFAMSIAIILLLMVILVSTFVNKLKNSRIKIDNLKEQVDSIVSDLEKKQIFIKRLTSKDKEQRVSLTKAQRQLNEHICRNLQNIDGLLGAYYSDATKSVKREQLIRVVDNYVRDFSTSENGYATVERLVNEYRDGIMERLRVEMPNLKENEYRLLCLIFADFSSNAICLFMGYDKNKLYKRKSYLKGILATSDCESKELFIRSLK